MTRSSNDHHLPLPLHGPYELDIDIDPAPLFASPTMMSQQSVVSASVAERRKGTPPVNGGHGHGPLQLAGQRPTRCRSATGPEVDVDLLDIDFLIDLTRFPKPPVQHVERSWTSLSDSEDDEDADADAASIESSLLPDRNEGAYDPALGTHRVTTVSAMAKWHKSVGLGLGPNDHFHLDDFPHPPPKLSAAGHPTGSPRGEWRGADRDSMPNSPVVTTPVTPLMSPPRSPNKASAPPISTSPIRCPTAQRCYFSPSTPTASGSPTSAYGGVSPRTQVKSFNKPHSAPVSRSSRSPVLSPPSSNLLSLAETTSDGGWSVRRESNQSHTSSGCVSSSQFSSSTFSEIIHTPPLLTLQPLPPVPNSRRLKSDRRSIIDESTTGGESPMPNPANLHTGHPDQGEKEYPPTLSAPGAATTTPTRKLSIARSVAQSIGGTSATSSTMSKGDGAKHDRPHEEHRQKGERAQVDRPHEEHRHEADAGNFVDGCQVCERMAEAWRRRRAMVERKKAGGAKAPKAKKGLRVSSSKSDTKAEKEADTSSRWSLDTNEKEKSSLSRTSTQQSSGTLRFMRGGGGHTSPPELPPLPLPFGSLQPHGADENAHNGVCTTCGCGQQPAARPGDAGQQKGKLFAWGRGVGKRSS